MAAQNFSPVETGDAGFFETGLAPGEEGKVAAVAASGGGGGGGPVGDREILADVAIGAGKTKTAVASGSSPSLKATERAGARCEGGGNGSVSGSAAPLCMTADL